MAAIGGEIVLKVGDDGQIVLREPTPREWNEFKAERLKVRRNRVTDNGTGARVALFDTLCVGIDRVEDASGNPITLETLDLIPVRLKDQWIFKCFEQDDGADIKN